MPITELARQLCQPSPQSDRSFARRSQLAVAIATLVGMSSLASAQVPIVQPGAPGQDSRHLSAEQASDLAGLSYTDADVKFMQGMIHHHQQAVEMTALVPDRSQRDSLRQLAERISLSQEDEMLMMENWLSSRGEYTALPEGGHAMHGETMTERMPGMATPEEMAELASLEGAEFDNRFLELMIKHHEGALTMVEDLLDQPGSAQDSVMFEFTSEVEADQSAEIERMLAMLSGFSPDPRVNLAAGYDDAGQASWNMNLMASLPKPDGFFDPENPAGLPMSRLNPDTGEETDEEDEEDRKSVV